MEKKILFIANAARWFDRVNGNTYHSVRITKTSTGETIFCEWQYGYGEQYRVTALKEMHRAGWIPEKYGEINLLSYEMENDYPIYWNVSDGTKKEMIKNGEK